MTQKIYVSAAPMPRWLRRGAALLFALLTLHFGGFAWLWTAQAKPAKGKPGRRTVSASATVGRFTFEVRENPEEDDQLLIRRNGRVVFRRDGYRFFLGTLEPEEPGRDNPTILGRDINGDGIPDVVVFEWTGGAHSAFVAYVFSVGRELKLLATLNGEHSVPVFTDLNGDGVLEIEMQDWTFAYWPECFASSPAPRVVLRWQDGQYRLAADLMQTPAPTAAALRKQARGLRRSDEWESGVPPTALWQDALNLIYGGHEAEAWELIARVWHKDAPMANAQLAEFCRLLQSSPHWRELSGTGIKSPAPAQFTKFLPQGIVAGMSAGSVRPPPPELSVGFQMPAHRAGKRPRALRASSPGS